MSDDNQCAVCSAPASKRCTNCKSVWYCGREHQVSDWKAHKARCKVIAADIAQAESHEIHKREFDRIRVKYGLDKDDKATEIAELLANTGANDGEFTLFANDCILKNGATTADTNTSLNAGVSAPEFASKFGMSVEEAVVFLEWIKVGIKFKEETLDNAKKAGLSG